MNARGSLVRFLLALCTLVAALAMCSMPALAAGIPVVDGQSVTGVGLTVATFHAKINPEESATSYHFEYGTTTAYGTSAPAHDAALGSGGEDVEVSQVVPDLQPGSTYHYRVVAASAEGVARGQDHVLHTYPSEAGGLDTCADAEIRQIQSSGYLPDCRAYEMVSPTYKKGGNVAADADMTQSATSGDAVKYYSTSAFGDAIGIGTRGAEYASQRGPDGWTTHSINPEQNSVPVSLFSPQQYQGISDDLTKGVFYAHTPVLPGQPNVEHVSNLYLRTDLLSAPPGSYELVSDSASPQPQELLSLGEFTAFAGASADWKRILFESVHNLTSDSPAQPAACLEQEVFAGGACEPRVYEWFNGRVRLVGILPNGEAATSSMAGAGAGGTETQNKGTFTEETISADGSRILFQTGPFQYYGGFAGGPAAGSGLYMRIDGRETIKLNVSERSEQDPGGPQPVMFQTATRDESKVFFKTTEALTDDAVVGGEGKLYMYDIDAPPGKRLTLIAPGVAIDGISADGEYVYFETEQQLTPNQPPPTGVGRALFVWHAGALRYITSHSFRTGQTSADSWDSENDGRGTPPIFRVSADGKKIAFGSKDPYTAEQAGYDNSFNIAQSGEEHYAEVYVYDYDADRLVCASCNPSGALPTSSASFATNIYVEGFDTYGPTELEYTNYKTRALSDDGRYVFFDTVDALLPQDVNGRRDVYEYDTRTSQVHLISGGTCDCSSVFADASADGTNVFFTTHQSLVRADRDTNSDVYDARVNGGIASQNAAPPAPCEGDDCQGPAKSVPTFSLPASSTFAGVGNSPSASSKPAVKAKPKSSAKRHKKSQKKKHKKRHRRKGAHSSGKPSRRNAH